MRYMRYSLPFVLLAACVVPGWANEDKITVVKMTVSPADEPREPLARPFLPGYLDRKPGNAALFYYRLGMQRSWRERDPLNQIDWSEMPLEEYRKTGPPPVDKTLLEGLALAVRRTHCDWQLPFDETDPISLILPELGALRQVARHVAAQARWHVAQGEFDEAIKMLRMGFALGQDVGKAPTLVHGLVGIACGVIMNERVEEMIQQPGCPNLYWSLTGLPSPLVDLRPAVMDTEANLLVLMFPFLRDVDAKPRSVEFWREVLSHKELRKFYLVAEAGDLKDEAATQLAVTGILIAAYPRARNDLIRQGFSREKIDAMPTAQVVVLHAMRTYRELRDQTLKWYLLPYWQAAPNMRRADEYLNTEGRRREVLPLASLLLPAVSAARRGEVRIDRDIAMLRCVEALRMHAARHGGRLPERLDQVTAVPVPLDPVWNKPFSYRLEGKTGILESLMPDDWPRQHDRRYEITIRE
ncbi:MAG: hypothetical protein JW818_18525 [Pirellulales bacterium]|nr:hypothetical protein [Pirellulales bacterium]